MSRGPSSGTLYEMTRDLLHAARSLAKDRVFTLVCVVSLGIGMGAFVALTTFARAITSPARGIDTDGLVELLVLPQGPLRARAGEWALEQWSWPDFQALRDADAGMAVTGWARGSSQIGTPSAEAPSLPRAATLYVSANYFSTMGVSLARGSGFDPRLDDAASAEPRVVVSHGYWEGRMASDPGVLGTSITIDGIPHVVVGVSPEDFRGHFHFFNSPNALLFLPLERHPRLRANPDLRRDRSVDWVRIYGRLDPGVDLARARAMVSATMAGLARQYPASNEFKAATADPYFSTGAINRPNARGGLGVFLGLSGAVLLIVCLNISGMMLVRATRRERELSIRQALGASRGRLVKHLFFEAVLLAVVASGLSAFVLFGIPAVIGWWLGAPVPAEIDLDATGVAIAVGLCLLVSVLFGLLPAVRFSRPSLLPLLKEDAYGGGRRTIRVHRVAAVAQIGLAIPFLVISGVMYDRVRTADLGFATDGLAAARLPAPAGSDERDTGFFIRRVRESLQDVAAVRAVAIAEGMPVDFWNRVRRVTGPDGVEFVSAQVTRVGEGFLETIGTPLLRGRPITADDRIGAASVAVISAPLAARLFPDIEAIGQRITIVEEDRDREVTVVGVSADFATSQLTTERPQLLLPLPESLDLPVYVIARGLPGDELQLSAALENMTRELNVDALPSAEGAFRPIVTGQDLVQKSLQDVFVESTVVAVAGNLVLLLAALGIVGVVGFVVATRQREFAVRMALGATRLRVFRLMLSSVVKLVFPGIAGGLVIAAILVRTMGDVMGTPLTLGPDSLGIMEPVIYAAASAIAVSVALLAGLPSARRATSVHPMVVLRAE